MTHAAVRGTTARCALAVDAERVVVRVRAKRNARPSGPLAAGRHTAESSTPLSRDTTPRSFEAPNPGNLAATGRPQCGKKGECLPR
jgi:hypothetical protein